MCDLLILDDLGTEYLSEPANAELFELIDQRIKNKKNTVISSNKDLSMIRETYDDRIVSRILENYKICMLTGQDVRAIHARERVLNNK